MRPESYEEMFEVEDLHWWYRSLRAILEDARRDFALDRGLTVDVGCGTGGVLARWPGRCLGMDSSPDGLRFAKRRTAQALFRADINDAPLADRSVDTVLCLDVLYHRAVRADWAVAEMWRILRPGGHVVINVPAYQWLFSEHDRAIHTAHRYSRREVRLQLVDAGFVVRRLSHWNASLLPMAVLYRLLTRGRSGSSDLADYRPGMFDDVAERLLGAEQTLMRRVSIPFGLSIFAVARKE